MTIRTIRFFRWLLLLIILAACSLGQADEAPPPTSTSVRIAQASLMPPATRDLQAAPSRVPEVNAITDIVGDACSLSGDQPAVRHSVDAQINYGDRVVEVVHNLHFINRTNDTLTEVVLDVEPNRVPNAFTLHSGSADIPLDVIEVVGRRLTLDLTGTLEPGCAIDVTLDYMLLPPPITQGISGLTGYFGHTNRQLNLGHWLPVVALYRDGEWITHDVTVIGEQIVAEVADWDVNLTVSNAPDSIIVAGAGEESRPSEDQWHYTLNASRDFVVSLSPFFRVASAATEQGVEIVIYSFDNALIDTPTGKVDGAQQALTAAVQSMSMYADLFGDYPDPRFIIVQGDFPDGMEFSGLVFVSDQWFRTNPGTPESYLTIITVHEVSHQWWYAHVGNDQALDPWLDEALATYSEYIYYEEFHPDLREWWWNFRVATFLPQNYSGRGVNSTVYEFATVREYINAVYLHGARMLDTMRGVLGTEVFFDWLRRYAATGANRVVGEEEFWSLLTPEQLDQIRPIRESYLDG